jgi:DNA repair protein RadA
MKLEQHDFEKDIPATLVVLDSITGKFRKEFEGRGTLSDRQVKLSSHVRLLESVVESKNIICLVTNQAQEALGVMGDNIRPVGGNVIGHTFTHRIYLKKPQSMSKDKITAILVDSPNKAKNEVVLELGSKGIQEPTV